MTRLLLLPVAAALLLPSFAEPLRAEDTPPSPAPPAAVAQLSPDIAMVRVIGPWSTGEQRGYSRLIELLNGGTLSLYVQWIVHGGSGPDQVVQTKQLEGAETVPDLPLAQIRVDAGTEDAEVQFQLPNAAGEDMQSWTLDVGPPGEARFGRASH
jgi:hypothetical protein